MLCLVFTGILIGVPSIIFILLHNLYYGMGPFSTSLIIFLMINFVITIWELALFYHFKDITDEHQKRIKQGFFENNDEGRKKRQDDTLILFRDYPISQMCKFRFWARIWTEYARYDDSYAYSNSFQWAIDVGNGHSTPIQTLFLLISFITPILSPIWTGLIGCIVFYQKWYGVVLYLFLFHYNKKGAHISRNEYIFAVLSTNGVWFIMPMIGMYVCANMILTNSYAPLHW